MRKNISVIIGAAVFMVPIKFLPGANNMGVHDFYVNLVTVVGWFEKRGMFIIIEFRLVK
jgi:hypothetical protein